jgi:hypothetical protein
MKNTLLAFLILFTFNTAFSQSDLGINLCGDTGNIINKKKSDVTTISKEAFLNCAKIMTNNTHLTVVSFSIGMSVGNDYQEIKITGNKLNEKVITSIKDYKPSKLYIEQVELSSKKGTIHVGKPLIVILKN